MKVLWMIPTSLTESTSHFYEHFLGQDNKHTQTVYQWCQNVFVHWDRQ